jgi:hypothetical protein
MKTDVNRLLPSADMTLCTLVVYQSFRGTYCIHFHVQRIISTSSPTTLNCPTSHNMVFFIFTAVWILKPHVFYAELQKFCGKFRQRWSNRTYKFLQKQYNISSQGTDICFTPYFSYESYSSINVKNTLIWKQKHLMNVEWYTGGYNP